MTACSQRQSEEPIADRIKAAVDANLPIAGSLLIERGPRAGRQVEFLAAVPRALKAVEDRHHRVIVARAERLEFVVVAASAA